MTPDTRFTLSDDDIETTWRPNRSPVATADPQDADGQDADGTDGDAADNTDGDAMDSADGDADGQDA